MSDTVSSKLASELADNAARTAEAAARLLTRVQQMPAAPVPQELQEKIGEQFSIFPEAVAAMPQEVARVALFGMPSDKRGVRKMLRNTELAGRRDVRILYTGEELGPKEETLWLACLRIGRGRRMGERIPMVMSDLMRAVGLRDTGGKTGSREQLKRRLDRLSAAHMIVTTTRDGQTLRVTTGLLKWGLVKETGKIYVRLDPDGAELFKALAYQPWGVRLALKSDAAARLLSYVCSHQASKPHRVLLDELRRWCGYQGRVRDWRPVCLAGLAELEARGVIVRDTSKRGQGVNGEVVSWCRAAAAMATDVLT